MFCNTNHLHSIHNNKTSTTKFYSKGLQLSNKQQHFHLLYLNLRDPVSIHHIPGCDQIFIPPILKKNKQ